MRCTSLHLMHLMHLSSKFLVSSMSKYTTYIPCRYNTQPTFYYILFMFGYYLSCKTHFLEYGIALSFTSLHVFHIHCNIWLSLLSFHLENKFFSHTLQLHGHSLAACYTTQSLFNFLLVITRFSHTL